MGRAYEDLDGEGEGVNECAVSRNNGFLLCLTLQIEVRCFNVENGAQSSIFEDHGVIANFSNGEVALRAESRVFLPLPDSVGGWFCCHAIGWAVVGFSVSFWLISSMELNSSMLVGFFCSMAGVFFFATIWGDTMLMPVRGAHVRI